MIKKFFALLTNRDIDMTYRLYTMLSMIAVICLLAMAGFTYFVTGSRHSTSLALLLSALFIGSETAYGTLTRRYRVGMILGTLYALLVLMPFLFFQESSIHGGMPIWLTLAAACVWAMFSGAARVMMMIAIFISVTACYAVAALHPEFVTISEHSIVYVESYVGVLFAVSALCTLFSFQRRTYDRERRLVLARTAELEEANRARSIFFSSMSHEIRTPINAIIGFNELTTRAAASAAAAADGDGALASVREIAANSENIRGASRMLLALVNDILDISKMQANRMEILTEPYDTASVIAEAASLTGGRMKDKGLSFRVSVDPALPRGLIGDDTRIKQMLVNLLSNAAKYTDEGTVSLAVSRGPDTPDGGATVIFEVTDTGIGIRSEDISKIFNVYRRVDGSRNRGIEGTGLGLAITSTLARLMGGEITVDSIYTKGSAFRLTIPQRVSDPAPVGDFAADRRPSGAERGSSRATFTAPGARLLIVDDNDMNRRVARGLLAPAGMTVDTASGGRECLAMTLERRYHAILMDHVMPGMDGVETLAAIRSQEGGLCRDTPVAAMTAAADGGGDFYISSGFDGYIPKPVDPAALYAAVRRMLPPELVTDTEGAQGAELEASGIIISRGGGAARGKRRIAITTESIADLTSSAEESCGVTVLPVYVQTASGRRFLDDREVDAAALTPYLTSPGASVRALPADRADYERFFAEQLTKAERVIHVTFCRGDTLMGSNAVLEAASAFGRVDVVDSQSISAGMGVLAIRAAEMARDGAGRDEILSELEALKHRVMFSFMIGDTRLTAATGRFSRALHSVSDALMLHPVCTFGPGGIRVRRFEIGRRASARRNFVRRALSSGGISGELLTIVWSGIPEAELSELTELAGSIRKFSRVTILRSAAAVYSNCGDGSIGLLTLKN